jgi:hypothetical protein
MEMAVIGSEPLDAVGMDAALLPSNAELTYPGLYSAACRQGVIEVITGAAAAAAVAAASHVHDAVVTRNMESKVPESWNRTGDDQSLLTDLPVLTPAEGSVLLIPRTLVPAYHPPFSVCPAVEVVYHDSRFADGDTLLLRGMLALAENLEQRLLLASEAMSREDGPNAEGSGSPSPSPEKSLKAKDSFASAEPSDMSFRQRPLQGILDLGNESDRDSDELLENEDFSHICYQLAFDESAEQMALQYRTKSELLTTPVLPQGGGCAAKLYQPHRPLMHQLVLLLRQAVRAFPPSTNLQDADSSVIARQTVIR